MSKKSFAIYAGRNVEDGDGVKIVRSIAGANLIYFDPFLMLDEIRSANSRDYKGGFPAHPHRGFETITYLKKGEMVHEDSLGNKGIIKSGGVQWLTAGKGIIHSEMPRLIEGEFHGFQLWLNLPACEKMCPPQYREFRSSELPIRRFGSSSQVRIISGYLNENGRLCEGILNNKFTDPHFYDVVIFPNDYFTIAPEIHQRVLIYVYDGQVGIDNRSISKGQIGVFEYSGLLQLSTKIKSRFLYIAGNKICEPISAHGPFVMNTDSEIRQALLDYRQGNFV